MNRRQYLFRQPSQPGVILGSYEEALASCFGKRIVLSTERSLVLSDSCAIKTSTFQRMEMAVHMLCFPTHPPPPPPHKASRKNGQSKNGGYYMKRREASSFGIFEALIISRQTSKAMKVEGLKILKTHKLRWRILFNYSLPISTSLVFPNSVFPNELVVVSLLPYH